VKNPDSYPPKDRAPNENEAVPESDRIVELQEKIRRYTVAIAALEHERDALLERRRGACDGVMVSIDELLSAHESAIGSVRSLLLLVQEDLDRAIGWKEGDSQPPR
jgi:hypothetical protein